MSQENVEIVEAIWAEFVRGRFPEDRFTDDVHGTSRTMSPRAGRTAAQFVARADVRKMLASFWETVDESWVEADQFVDAGESVIVRWRGGGIGTASRLPVEWRETHV